jgi:hypothetical protein
VNNNSNSNTVVKQVDGRATPMTNTTRTRAGRALPPSPLQDHAGSIPGPLLHVLNIVFGHLFL